MRGRGPFLWLFNIIIVVSIFLLRLMRGIMFNLQWANNAMEHRADTFNQEMNKRKDEH